MGLESTIKEALAQWTDEHDNGYLDRNKISGDAKMQLYLNHLYLKMKKEKKFN